MFKPGWIITAASILVLIVAGAMFLLFKLGQQNIYSEKWGDYDDYGWS